MPTMGALHAGHRSLIERAAAECDHVAVTIFVNPLQFGDPDDIEHYPRTLEPTWPLCQAGVATVLAPSVAEMYPDWPAPLGHHWCRCAGSASRWEGVARPGHFDGVATVVAKLFSMAGRCRAYFGEKDFQQLAVVRRLVADLSMPVEVVGCPTVREADGLALSSRNVRLSPGRAGGGPGALPGAGRRGRRPSPPASADPAVVASRMAADGGGRAAGHARVRGGGGRRRLAVPDALDDGAAVRLLVAARVGPVRLIDNCAVPVPLVMAAAGAIGHNAASD